MRSGEKSESKKTRVEEIVIRTKPGSGSNKGVQLVIYGGTWDTKSCGCCTILGVSGFITAEAKAETRERGAGGGRKALFAVCG